MKQYMTKKINLALSLLVIALAALTIGLPSAAYAASTCGVGDTTPKGQVLQGAGETGTDCTGTGVKNIITTTVSILSYVIGAVAIIVIILAGLKYVLSAGDANRISSAKNTLVYALVGLVIAALAQVLVHYVLSQAANASNNPAKPGGYLPGVSRTAADA